MFGSSNATRRSMVPNARPMSFRISGIPREWNENDLLRALRAIDPYLGGQWHQVALYPACFGSTQTAVLSLAPCTNYFQSIPKRTTHYEAIGKKSGGTFIYLEIDSHFYGLTPLNDPRDEAVVDVVAVTGLAGHAFGSWRSRITSKMWLKDFLPNDLGRVRIMTYGYNSSLTQNGSEDGFFDYTRDLIVELENARRHDRSRPIIFVGHSLGGLLILQILIAAGRNPSNRNILNAVQGIVLFGTPHNGLRTYDLEEMVDAESGGYETSKKRLLKQLREGSGFLETQKLGALNYVLKQYKPRILSFYEIVPTPTVLRNSKNTYERGGLESMMVERLSSQLYVPNEIRQPVEEDHSNMVKFNSANDLNYYTMLRYLREWVDDASRKYGV